MVFISFLRHKACHLMQLHGCIDIKLMSMALNTPYCFSIISLNQKTFLILQIFEKNFKEFRENFIIVLHTIRLISYIGLKICNFLEVPKGYS